MKELFTTDYWIDIWKTFATWFVNEFPGIIILFVLLIVSLKLLNFFTNKLGIILKKKAKRASNYNESEVEKRVNTFTGIICGAGKVLIWVAVVVTLLKKVGIDIKPVLASAGFVGLAIGFGAQELIRDVISGAFMLLENQVRTGDVAIINGTGGLVEKIELRTITLRDFSGVVHIFQNGKINSLSNMTKEWSAMVFDIGVAYKEDPEEVIQVMTEVGAEMQKDSEFGKKILEPIEVVGVDAFADSAVVIRARFKTKPIEQWNVGREYRKRLKKAFDKRNIEIPFPHQTIYWGEKIGPLKMKIEGKEE